MCQLLRISCFCGSSSDLPNEKGMVVLKTEFHQTLHCNLTNLFISYTPLNRCLDSLLLQKPVHWFILIFMILVGQGSQICGRRVAKTVHSDLIGLAKFTS